jgi:hypothetical protein
MRRRLTLLDALVALASLLAGAATFSCALYALMSDRPWAAAIFASGGIYLVLWAAVRVAGPI